MTSHYLKSDFSRKPQPEMILQAREERDVDLASTVLTGDKVSYILEDNAAAVGVNLPFAPQRIEDLNGLDC